MTLEDIFKPNQYGTIPIIVISGIGTVTKYSDTHARCQVKNRPTVYVPLTCEAVTNMQVVTNKLSVSIYFNECVELSQYAMYLSYIKQASAEERLIAQAIGEPYTIYVLEQDGKLSKVSALYKVLPNGSGWFDGKPVIYYLDDILYRLDLQQKLT